MRRYQVDVNLPRHFSFWASSAYEFVADHDPTWTDSGVWNYASRNVLTIVSKDADFSDRVMLSKDPPRVMHFRTGNLKINAFHNLLSEVWPEALLLSETHRLVLIYRDRLEAIA